DGANLDGANLDGANLYGAENKDQAYLPIFMKWRIAIKGDTLKIGCKEMTFTEWEEWFKGEEVFDTQRDTEDFKRIQASFLAYKAYYEFLKI
ncbi:pentapeptide repeat-containing protein, partial [Chryseobacterium sp.]|uniref:pentapeptide repeat-containing protein n=1 Tax=Chryseobacterium sp. TaxID=1871047 RepID=UPI00289CFD9E